jgi:riboflavin synthase
MFTGIIQDLGRVSSIFQRRDYSLVTIETQLSSEITVGDSISVSGVCLTAVSVEPSSFQAEIMVQTLKLSSLQSLKAWDKVNLELATRVDSRLGGHIVQGHVDGVGKVLATKPGDKWLEFQVEIPQHLLKYVVNQGSISIDGVSLTVGEVNDKSSSITLWLIPETLKKTTLSERSVGDIVNIEVDILAKYIERLLEKRVEIDK